MRPSIGLRREDKSPYERRAPLPPEDAGRLIRSAGLDIVVQRAPNRIFADSEYRSAGAKISDNLSGAPIVFGIKEVSPDRIEAEKTYVIFAHVIKGQPHNMPMLRRMLELGCTLIDYERVADDAGRRLIFFGRFAGIAGTLEALWALGQRWAWENVPTPFSALRRPMDYRDVAQAKAHVAEIGAAIRNEELPEECVPLIVGVTGYGNVSRGAWEILKELPIQEVAPGELPALCRSNSARRDRVYATTFREEHIVEPINRTEPFDLRTYYDHPERYTAAFDRYLPFLNVIVNGIYWDSRYPRLVTRRGLEDLWRAGKPRLKVIGDISCDIDGSMQCTVRSTRPDAPTFVYNPLTRECEDGCCGDGLVVMSIDILPAEVPRDASICFSEVLARFVPPIAAADYRVCYEDLVLPPEIKRAVIAHRGQLAPEHRQLSHHL